MSQAKEIGTLHKIIRAAFLSTFGSNAAEGTQKSELSLIFGKIPQVDTGTLAIFNDLKIPLAVAVSLVFFGEQASLLHLLLGGVIVMAALLLNEVGLRRLESRASAV